MARANRSSSKREEEQMVESINEWEPVEYRSEGKAGKQGYLKKKKKKNSLERRHTLLCLAHCSFFSDRSASSQRERNLFTRKRHASGRVIKKTLVTSPFPFLKGKRFKRIGNWLSSPFLSSLTFTTIFLWLINY